MCQFCCVFLHFCTPRYFLGRRRVIPGFPVSVYSQPASFGGDHATAEAEKENEMALNQQEVSHVKSVTTSALVATAGLNSDAVFALIDKMSQNIALLDAFKKDPEGVARQEGITIPAGFHLHYIAPDNSYMPDEAAAIKQLQDHGSTGAWSRVEVRYAVGPLCIGACGVCNAA